MVDVSDLAPIFHNFTKATSIVVTEGAQHALLGLINSVESDPHETWQTDPEHYEQFYARCQALLPDVLHSIQEEHRLIHQITTVDVYYWVGKNLDRIDLIRDLGVRLCFPPPDQIPPTPMMVFPWYLNRRP